MVRSAELSQKNYDAAVKKRKASGYFLFEAAAHRYPNEECIWSRQGVYTWAETYQRVSQYGHYFQSLGVTPAQYVGLYMYNSPEFLFIWLGLLSIGAAPALINYNLTSGALLHCVKISGTKILIYDSASDCASRIEEYEKELRDIGVEPIVLSGALQDKIGQNPTTRPITNCFEDEETPKTLSLALMFTSGTTGMPKASPLGLARNYMTASLHPRMFGQKPGPGGDRNYYCIPLYHGTGGLGAINDMMSGLSVALAPKFSLSRFWTDCIDSKATIFTYVGELVRYLLAAPPSPNDKKHQIRLVWGNGLSPELWTKFQERFGVAEIGEFFSSTETVFFLSNHVRGGYGLGAVGHHGWLLRQQSRNMLVPVHIDPETGDVSRSPATGFAKRLPYEEGGELLVRLPSRDVWAGYHGSEEATRKKLVENVFEKGDLYWRSGDALRRTADGHWYFMDRLGTHPGIVEANVYGVKIPSHDGRAGCAALVLEDGDATRFDWTSLTTLLRRELPAYAVPIFVRVRKGLGGMSTGNYKHNKVPLRREGVDPQALGTEATDGKDDLLLWLPAGSHKYIPFTQGDWDKLSQFRARI
ncbi:hypothetical protein ED733_000718 [Metarhizium rileyi]|uniref:Very long-chain fatty acid transport protein n=1 Tax=Metarhizium rileyi (strain RCEF 4871) TaxID=1649241 RepID=A0A5C6GC67_METRR|nr:hypothetical protein ED733_000718 [Metarhizium rileyi]